MAARRFLLTVAVSLAASACVAPLKAFAQAAPAAAPSGQGEVENAKRNFIGQINANNVFVRSAPREDAYPTVKLDKGAQVTVVGMKFKWLKILPPEGSFALVPKAYVNLRGNGKVGRASRETTAKVGSALNQLKTAPMAKIDDGQDVEIVGEAEEYYKIKPPEGSFLYVAENFVEPLKVIPPTPDAKGTIADKGTGGAGGAVAAKPTGDKTKASGKPTKGSDLPTGNGDEFVKTETPTGDKPSTANDATAEAPATQPAEAVASASAAYEKLEADFKAANAKSIQEQPVESLLSGYEELLKQDALDRTMRKVAEVRVSTLKLRAEAKTEFAANQKAMEAEKQKQASLDAERQEIQQQIKEREVTMFTAVGTLRTSSLQRGGTMLYRLTDPSTGRTVAYLRSNDPKYATFIGQFIGVKGTVTTESALNMKVIDAPTGAQQVDPAKVNSSVAAQIIPPSLVGTRSASTLEQ